jgi:hypothetical protein
MSKYIMNKFIIPDFYLPAHIEWGISSEVDTPTTRSPYSSVSMTDKPEIPEGFQELEEGEKIKGSDHFWAHGIGPWTKHKERATQIGKLYNPVGNSGGIHWWTIRRIV